ncbi:MAG: phosphatase PAP2 family protein [Alphaproteobacteria bacterium]|nr:phosphatase PAP2 family protein [Alphaproteobacteria bacterium]
MTPHPWYWPRPAPIARFWAATVTAAVLAAIAAGWLDRPVAIWFQARGEGSMDVFRALSVPGDSVWYLVGGGIGSLAAYVLSRRMQGPVRERLLRLTSRLAFLFLAVAATGLAADLLKVLVGRARPKHLFQDGLMALAPGSLSSSWWSFPSGHATTIGAVAVALALLAPRLVWAWMLLALVVALGRIGATAHFVSDTVAGLWLGAAGATIVSWALARRAEAIERRLGLPRCVG